jgi:NADH dehydrogenase [ubiquinone] 1 alpha subcomplex assembly factor 7
MSVAEFMETCLSHPDHGYYMNRDVFGSAGDFITSPEISQLFGEMVGVWVASLWQQLKCPASWSIIELGPGRGTLSLDIMRTLKDLGGLNGLHYSYVDMSPALTHIQQKTVHDYWAEEPLMSEQINDVARFFNKTASFYWAKHLSQVIEYHTSTLLSHPVLCIAHEFFDALPVHSFQFSSEKGWCERQVRLKTDGKFEICASNGPTTNVRLVLKPERRFSAEALQDLKDGDMYEVAAASQQVMTTLCDFLANRTGCGLVIDYGESRAFSHSLRVRTRQGIKAHTKLEEHEWLNCPGEADLSAYVNFADLKTIAGSYEGLQAAGPYPQGLFLECLGIAARTEILQKSAKPAAARRLEEDYRRLVSPESMGEIYKVLYFGSAQIGEVYPMLKDLTYSQMPLS